MFTCQVNNSSSRILEKDPGASLADSVARTHELLIAGETLPQKNKAARGRGEHSLSSGLHTCTGRHVHTCVHTQHTHIMNAHRNGLLCLAKEISRQHNTQAVV